MTENGGNNGRALAIYGERSEVKELSQRITNMLPGVRQMGGASALALAQVAHSMGLNPFTGEVWAIPQRSGGQVVGFSIMAGIKGLRRAAKIQAKANGGIYPYYCPKFRLMSDEEKELADLKAGDKGLICELEVMLPPGHPWYRANKFQRFIVEGVGIFRQGERTKMEPMQVVRKRAEADALKIAFDLPFGDQNANGDYVAIDADYEVFDSEEGPEDEPAVEEATEQPAEEPEPESVTTNGGEKGQTWPAPFVWALTQENLAADARQAVAVLNESGFDPDTAKLDEVLAHFRGDQS